MPICPECKKNFYCSVCGHTNVDVSTSKPCVKRAGAIWVHVVDDDGGDVNGAQISVGRDSKPTANGIAAFDPRPAGSYDVTIGALTDPLDQLYDPAAINDHRVGVVDGRITYVVFELVRRARLTVLVRYSRTLVALDGDATVSVPGTVHAAGHTLRDTTGPFRVSRGTYTISTALSDQLPGCAIAPAQQDKRVPVPPGGDVTETIYIEPPGEVKVKVTRADTGADVPGVNVAINGPISGHDNTGADGTFGVRNAGAGRYTITLTLSADLLDQFLAPAAIAPIDLAQSQISDTPVVLQIRPAPLLQMFLNGQRRDGQVVDNAPTTNGDWQWGPGQTGAILNVKTRNYANGDIVSERSLLRLKWQNDFRANWMATLAVDHANHVRIYRNNTEGAQLLLGDTTVGPLDLFGDAQIRAALQGAQQCDLWMEAIDYPETEREPDWLVQITLTFQWRGNATPDQSAVLRIAPWIMASDLDQTLQVYVRTVGGHPDGLSGAVIAFGATAFPLGPLPKKGFARDVMASGYSVGPHYSGIVIQGDLDTGPLVNLPQTAAADATGALITKPRVRAALTNQDNGGNLLVSPPSAAYPWGRILYGQKRAAGPDDLDYVCQSAAFYKAQQLQDPIELDSTWLKVGHVDEMLSFVRATDGTYAALLMSPRLAFIMLSAVASANQNFPTASALVDWANGVNNRLIARGPYQEPDLLHELAPLDRVASPPLPADYMKFVAVAAVGDNPPVPGAPVNPERFVIMRVSNDRVVAHMRNAPIVGALANALEAIFPANNPDVARPDSYELWVHASRFLGRDVQLGLITIAQPILDGVRELLINTLGIAPASIIEVPVLLNTEDGRAIALTGDSVNLLQRVAARNGASRCLVPKPFGPVFGGEYVFENHLTRQFASLNLQAPQYCADDRFHVNDGEIHCGTNQTHPALSDADLRKWWEWQ